jgi:hypothetical protein
MPKSLIPTYFSHSYRLEDQQTNREFWKLLSEEGFSFFVDPPSDSTIHTHLERMMRRSSAFVAVVNRRQNVKSFCSSFILYEYGLSIQARRPRLLLIDRQVGAGLFEKLDPDERYFFSPADAGASTPELRRKIKRLRKVASAFPNTLGRPRGPIGLMVPGDGRPCGYAEAGLQR